MLQKIKQWFKSLFSPKNLQAFEDWLKEVFTAEKALLLASLKAFATSAVATAASTGLSSEEKRKQALNSIIAQAQTAGIAYTASAVSLALEMAYTAFKNNQVDK